MARSTYVRRILFSLFLLAILLVAGYWYLQKNQSLFEQLQNVDPILAIPMLFFIITHLYWNGLETKLVLDTYQIFLSGKEIFALSLMTSFNNLILPLRGGMVSRAVYLNRRYNFRYSDFIGTTSGIYIILFWIISVIAMFVFGYLALNNQGSWLFFLLFTLLSGAFLLITWLSYTLPESQYKIVNKFIRILNSWNEFKHNRTLVFQMTILMIIEILSLSVTLFCGFWMLNTPVLWWQVIFLAAMGQFTLLIALTPSGIGIREGIVAVSAHFIGLDPATAIVASLIPQVLRVIFLTITGPITTMTLLNQMIVWNEAPNVQ